MIQEEKVYQDVLDVVGILTFTLGPMDSKNAKRRLTGEELEEDDIKVYRERKR